MGLFFAYTFSRVFRKLLTLIWPNMIWFCFSFLCLVGGGVVWFLSFFYFFVCLKALLILTSEWAHLISNSQRFRFYGCSKLGRSRKKIAKNIGIPMENGQKIFKMLLLRQKWSNLAQTFQNPRTLWCQQSYHSDFWFFDFLCAYVSIFGQNRHFLNFSPRLL